MSVIRNILIFFKLFFYKSVSAREIFEKQKKVESDLKESIEHFQNKSAKKSKNEESFADLLDLPWDPEFDDWQNNFLRNEKRLEDNEKLCLCIK